MDGPGIQIPAAAPKNFPDPAISVSAYQPSFDESVQTFKLTGTAFPWTIAIVVAVIAILVIVGLTIFLVRRKGKADIPPAMPPPAPSAPPA